jgi:hypothetical protein
VVNSSSQSGIWRDQGPNPCGLGLLATFSYICLSIRMDNGLVLGDGGYGQGEAGWSTSHPRMAMELNGGGVCRHQWVLESQPSETLGKRREGGEEVEGLRKPQLFVVRYVFTAYHVHGR